MRRGGTRRLTVRGEPPPSTGPSWRAQGERGRLVHSGRRMKTEASATAGRPPPWREVFQGRRGRLTAGLLLLEALVAVQLLVVATIMPDVRRALGMVQLYGLAFTASSLAGFGAIPIAGRALDVYG